MSATDRPAVLSPAAMERLGFQQQPFADNHRGLFEDAAHSTQLNVVLNMLQASDRILLIRGEPGVGKSAFVDQLQAKETDGILYCRMGAANDLTLEQIARECIRQFDFPEVPGEGRGALLEHLNGQIRAELRRGGRPVLIVDDAAELSVHTLEELFRFREDTMDSAGGQLGLILVGDERLDEHMDAIRQSRVAGQPMHTIKLYPFSERQASDYLDHRLNAALPGAGALISPAEHKQIYAQSRGIPSRINQEASRILEGLSASRKAGKRGAKSPKLPKPPKPPKIKTKRSGGARRANQIMVGIVSVLVAVLVAGLLALHYFAETGPGGQTVTVTGPAAVAPASQRPGTKAPGDTSSAPAVPGSDNASLPGREPSPAKPEGLEADTRSDTAPPNEQTAAPEAPQPPLLTSARETDDANAETPAEKPAKPLPVEKQQAPTVPAEQPPVTEEKKPAPAEEPASAKVEPRNAALADTKVEPTNTDLRWLLDQPARNYTVQLVAAYERSSLDGFRSGVPKTQRTAVIRTLREGKDWYIVVMGSFGGKRAAVDARAKLPERLRSAGAWIRSFQSIRNDLPKSP